MKHFILRLSVALLTFAIGLTITSGFLSFIQIPEINVISEEEEIISCSFPYISENEESSTPEIRFKRFITADGEPNAVFELVNNTSEPIRYRAYAKNHYCTLVFNNGRLLKEQNHCSGRTSLATQTLYPNETAVYRVNEFAVREFFKIKKKEKVSGKFGFHIFVGADKQDEVIWSEDITFPN